MDLLIFWCILGLVFDVSTVTNNAKGGEHNSMDENNTQGAQRSSTGKFLIPAVVLGVIVIAAIAFFAMNQSKNNSSVDPTGTMEAVTSAPTQAAVETQPTATVSASEFKDGEYDATGHYVSPGGPRDVDVTITLADGVITDAIFLGHATDPNSKRFQGEFRDNFKPLVVGKNIDDVQLTKVAGSSLSPKGFMDALEKIKTEAQS
jgi:uncharacterized protein with FMN-binding domain